MAEFTIDIPDNQVPRLVTAVNKELIEGDAVDLENPTSEEIRLKAKSICIDHLKTLVLNSEIQIHEDSFLFEDIGMT